MPRPLYPNDYIKSFGWRIESGSLLIPAVQDYAVHGSAGQYIIAPVSDFGSVNLDANTLYELEFGPFYLVNGDGGVATNARDGALARIDFWTSIDGGPFSAFSAQDFVLRRPDPYWYQVDSVKAYYYADSDRVAEFGVGLSHMGGIHTPGPDICRALPASKTTSTGTSTGANTTEVKDTNLGDLSFTGIAGRTYRVRVRGAKTIIATAGNTVRLRLRNGGASSPTTSSTLVIERSKFHNTPGGVGEEWFQIEGEITPSTTGTQTVALFLQGDGTNIKTLVAAQRELLVEDVTAGASAITDGKILVLVSGSDAPSSLKIRPVADASALNYRYLT